jgi:ribonuclease HII
MKRPRPEPSRKALTRLQSNALERIGSSDAEYVIGVDEVGLGSLAGPLVVGAVVLPKNWKHDQVTDSKRLTHKKRVRVLAEVIYPAVLLRCVLHRGAEDIDRYGIEQCRKELTEGAILFCRARYPSALAVQDGDNPVTVDGSLRGVVHLAKADFLVPAVSAASILAKVTRDLFMEEAHKVYPQYNFLHNRGYGSQEHCDAIVEHGPCLLHRMSFRKLPELIAARLTRV